MSKYGGSQTCTRCKKAVYMAEQTAGPGGVWHKACLTCKECNKRLDSTTLTENNNEAYCKSCYGKLFGPKGYGFSGGNGLGLSTDSTISNEQRFSPPQPRASTSYITPTPQSQSPRSSISHSEATPTLPEQVPPSGPNLAAVKPKFGSAAKFGGADKCPKCGKAVYFAEQILGPGTTKYHKLCFRCTDCNKMLDSTNMADKDGVVYCKGCHGKKFGPKGFGFGGGAAFLTTD